MIATHLDSVNHALLTSEDVRQLTILPAITVDIMEAIIAEAADIIADITKYRRKISLLSHESSPRILLSFSSKCCKRWQNTDSGALLSEYKPCV